MGADLSWLENTGLDTEEGRGYTGGGDKYISALQRFVGNYEKTRAKIVSFYEAEDFENFMIIVHALKSNARMIGAGALSSSFELLEKASREGDVKTIEEHTGGTLFEYDQLVEKLRPITELGEVKPADEIDADQAKELSDKLIAALDDFDVDLSLELIGKLSGYPFRITQWGKLDKARECINDFMYDEAADLIREILPSIE